MALAPPSALLATPSTSILAPPVILTASLPVATIGILYTGLVSASGGIQPYSWKVNAGMLPPGLSLVFNDAQSILIKGTPTALGSYSFDILCTDAIQQQTLISMTMVH